MGCVSPDVRPCDDLGSLRGFERFHRDYFGYVWAVLAHLGVPDATIDDAHQEVFLTCYRRRDSFRPDHPIKPWLVGIARRVAFRHRRSQQRLTRKLSAIAAHGPARGDDPGARVEARILLERFIAALDPVRREAFILAELEGRSGLEIAEALGIHLDAAYARVRQARAALTRELVRLGERPAAPARVSRSFALLLPELTAGGGKAATWGAALVLRSKEAWVAASLLTGFGLTAAARPDPPPVTDTSGPAPRSPRAATPAPAPTATAAFAAADAPAAPTASPPDDLPPQPTPSALAPAPIRRSLRGHAFKDMSNKAFSIPDPTALVDGPALSRLGEEAQLLARAQQALAAGWPEQALLHLDAYATAFPSGTLLDASAVLRIEGLCALRRIARAREEASAFLRARPHSGVARKVAGSCAFE